LNSILLENYDEKLAKQKQDSLLAEKASQSWHLKIT
jgi:hypothetical protein